MPRKSKQGLHIHAEVDDRGKVRGFQHEHWGPHPGPKSTFRLLTGEQEKKVARQSHAPRRPI